MRVRPRTRSRSRLTRRSSAMQSEIPSRTLGAAEAVTVPKVRLVAGAGVSPEQRSVFLREPPAFPGWLLVLLAAPDSATHSPVRTATSLAAAMLLSAASLRGWRAGWLAALGGWGGAAIGMAIG